jgi:Putative transposase
MMAAAVDEPDARPGMVAVLQTFGSSLKWNPHIHSFVSRGVWNRAGRWLPLPYVDTHKAELLFRHKVFRLLRDRDLITQERIDLLRSSRHSGFSVHNHTTVYPSDTEGLHKLACYLMRSPVNLSRLRYHPQSELILYEPKAGHDAEEEARLDPLEFLR